MPVSPEFRTRTLAQFQAARPGVTVRPMFGGTGIYLDGVFCGVQDDDGTYFKHPEARDWQPPHGPQPYIAVPDSVMADPAELGTWLDAAAAHAVARKSKRR